MPRMGFSSRIQIDIISDACILHFFIFFSRFFLVFLLFIFLVFFVCCGDFLSDRKIGHSTFGITFCGEIYHNYGGGLRQVFFTLLFPTVF